MFRDFIFDDFILWFELGNRTETEPVDGQPDLLIFFINKELFLGDIVVGGQKQRLKWDQADNL
ncbi:MAG: hypothetical protein ACD_75C00253G0001, partial [uncultured bacterium]